MEKTINLVKKELPQETIIFAEERVVTIKSRGFLFMFSYWNSLQKIPVIETTNYIFFNQSILSPIDFSNRLLVIDKKDIIEDSMSADKRNITAKKAYSGILKDGQIGYGLSRLMAFLTKYIQISY